MGVSKIFAGFSLFLCCELWIICTSVVPKHCYSKVASLLFPSECENAVVLSSLGEAYGDEQSPNFHFGEQSQSS